MESSCASDVQQPFQHYKQSNILLLIHDVQPIWLCLASKQCKLMGFSSDFGFMCLWVVLHRLDSICYFGGVAVLVSVKLQCHNSPLMEMLLGVGWLWNALCVCASHMKEWLLCTWFELAR